MARVSLALFGGFKLRTASGDAIHLPTRKTQALLAYLAMRLGDEQPRDALTALLWGDRGDAQARDSLRHALTEIRRTLGAVALLAREGAVGLDPRGIDVDVCALQRLAATEDLESLERAAALYRGDLLAGFTVSEPAFEAWLLGERERLRELVLDVLARLLAAHARHGRVDRAIQTAVRLLALDPLQEAVHRTLMRLYVRQGRRGAALRQYQLCVAALQRELGSEPEPETTSLYRAIVRGRSAEAGPPKAEAGTLADEERGAESAAARAPVAGAIAIAAPELPVHDTAMVGRSAEMDRLRRLHEQARSGLGGVVVVSGEAGAGKSRLVAELAAHALARGDHVLLGRCHASTQMLAFGPWVEAFRLAGVIEAGVLDGMGPAWRAELARLFPEAAAPGLPASSELPLPLFEAVVRLLHHVARTRPTLVVLEDCHWADEMTLGLVAFVARRVGAWPVMLAVTVRDDETIDAPPVQRTLAELRRERLAHELTAAPLTRADVADLVRGVLGHGVDLQRAERLERRVWAASEGNPFVALEALRAWGHEPSAAAGAPPALPDRVRELVTTRLARLGDTAQALVAVAAVVGREFDFAVLQQAAGLSEDEAAGGVEELVRRRILSGVGERFHFTHDRIREVAHGALLPQRRRLIHARVVTVLEHAHRQGLDEHALTLAQHSHEAALWDRALAYWRRAAAQAAERSALRQAADCLEAALAALDRLPAERRDVIEQSIDVRLDLRAALFAGGGDVHRVGDLLAAAAALASAIGDERRLARILIMQTHYHGIIAGAMGPAEACARRAVAIAQALDDPRLVARAGSLLGRVQHGRAAYREAVDTLTRNLEFIAAAAADDDWPLVLPASLGSRLWLTFALADVGRFDEALASADEAVRRVDATTHPYRRYHAYWARVAVHLERGDSQRALEEIAHMRVALRETDMRQLADNVAGLAGRAHALAGRLDEAVTLLERALAASARDAFAGHRDILYLGEAYLAAGRLDDAGREAERALALARGCGQPGREARAFWLLGSVHRARGDDDAAAHLTGHALRLADDLGLRPLVAHCRAARAALHLRAGRHADAAGEARAAAALYDEMRMPYWRQELERRLAATSSPAASR